MEALNFLIKATLNEFGDVKMRNQRRRHGEQYSIDEFIAVVGMIVISEIVFKAE
jgi:hypothetical protein